MANGISSGNVPSGVVDLDSSQTLENKNLTAPDIDNGSVTGASIETPSRLDVKQDTFANLETYAASASNGQIVFATDLKQMYQVVDNALVEVGSGGGGINYAPNSDAESGVAELVSYADAASEAPVDGTGGSPSTITVSQETSSPLRDNASFKIAKSAVNGQGEGAAMDFDIAVADQAKVLRISFDYNSSANYADGDIRVYVYDKTNASLIEVVDRDLPGNAQGKYIGEFQSNSDSTSYRLIMHVASTNATAYDLIFDDLQVGPRDIAKGSVITDWQEYTPTFSNLGSPTGVTFEWRRVGANIEIKGDFTSGTVAGSTATFSIPSGLQIVDFGTSPMIGEATIQGSSPAVDRTFRASSTTVGFSSSGYVGLTGTQIGSSNLVSCVTRVPIQGWSANSSISTDFGNKIITAHAYLNSAANHTSSGAIQDVPLDAVLFDTTNSFDTVNNEYILPESGYYQVNGTVYFNGVTASSIVAYYIQHDGNNYRGDGREIGGTGADVGNISLVIKGTKGDSVKLRAFQNSAASEAYVTGSTETYLTIHKVQSPQTLIGSEKVLVKAAATSQAIATGGFAPIAFTTELKDTHNAFNGTTFTVPVSGDYLISCNIEYPSSSATFKELRARINGGGNDGQVLDFVVGGFSTAILFRSGTTILPNLEKGDLITVELNHALGSNLTIAGSGVAYNHLSISLIK